MVASISAPGRGKNTDRLRECMRICRLLLLFMGEPGEPGGASDDEEYDDRRGDGGAAPNAIDGLFRCGEPFIPFVLVGEGW